MDNILATALWEGLVVGFGLAFLIGPVFFALLDASLNYGFRVSVAIALGVVSSDVTIFTISYISLNRLLQIPHFQSIMAIVGGLVLVGTGWIMIKSRNEIKNTGSWHIKDVGKLFVKGYSINTFNPFPWMFWFSTSTMVHSQFDSFGWQAPVLFFSAAAGMVLFTDVVKAGSARFLLPYLNKGILSWFRIISGIALMGFGIRLLVLGFHDWNL